MIRHTQLITSSQWLGCSLKPEQKVNTLFRIQLCDTADMSAVWYSRHACCVTQQLCLLCDTADRTAVWHSRHVPPHWDKKPWFCIAAGQGQAPPMLTTQLFAMAHTKPTSRKTLILCRRRAGACHSPPGTQNHGFVSQTQLRTQIDDLLRH